MTAVLRPPAAPVRPRRAQRAFTALLAVPILAVAAYATCEPATVPRLAVDNPTTHHLVVTVASTPDGAVVPLGTVRRGQSEQFDQVPDQGGRWIFHVSYAGVPAGTFERTRSELSADGWHVTLPRDSDGPLDAAGLAPSPT